MNKEEKEAIEILKQIPDYSWSYYKRENAIAIVLNLIEKQQEEILDLKYKVREHICIEAHEQVQQLYISKDKIREKIKELKSIGKYKLDHKDLYLEQESIDLLQELLGEEDE